MIFHHKPFSFQRIEQINTPNGRFYATPDGRKYPSVTTILGSLPKPGLDAWKKRLGAEEAKKVGQQAAKRGSMMHKMCEDYLSNKEIPEDTHPMGLNRQMFDSIKDILDTRVTEVYGIEFPVYSHKLKTAGTCDFYCEFDGKRTILDFKTSTRAKLEEWIENYFIQCSVYAMCLWEIYGIKIEQIAVLIAVEHDQPQLFLKDPMDYMPRALQIFKDYAAGVRY